MLTFTSLSPGLSMKDPISPCLLWILKIFLDLGIRRFLGIFSEKISIF